MPGATDVEIWKVILQAVAALVGIVGVIWTIIWAIRSPKLRISLLDSRGDLTRFGDSPDAPLAFFYHLRVRNGRKWTANNVRVRVTMIAKASQARGDGEQRAPVYLIWAAHPSPKPYLIDVLGRHEEACNLGYITEEERRFKLDAMDPARFGQNYKWPPTFQGFINGKETMRVELVAVAENARSNTLCLNITWDGQWCGTSEEMQERLVVSTIRPGALTSVRSRLGLIREPH
jgi:hypothetical protein